MLITKDFTLFNYQNEVVQKALQYDSYALFVEMGLGKTLMALSIMLMRHYFNGVYRVLVVCPKTVSESWLKEIDRIKKVAGFFTTIDAQNLASKRVKEAEAKMNDLSRLRYGLIIDVINFEKLYSISEFPQYDMLIIDESTRIKNPNAKRTQAVFQKLKNIPYRLILTGSPIVRDVPDIWAQLYIVDAIDVSYEYFRKEVKKDKTSWANFAKSNIVMLTKEDIESLGLMKFPKKEYRTIRFDLSDEANLYYMKVRELIKKSVFLSDKKKILAHFLQMQRITSGFNPFTLKPIEDNRKLKLLGHILKMGYYDFPVIIWATFVKDIEIIYTYLRELGFRGAMIYGKIPHQERKRIINDFQDKKYDFLVAHPVVLGIGVTLVSSNVCIYYSNSFRFEDRVQSEDRIHRVNQPKDVCYYIDLVARNTIDELVLQNLKNKKTLSEMSAEEIKRIAMSC